MQDDATFFLWSKQLPYNWDGKNYYKHGKKLYFKNNIIYNYDPNSFVGVPNLQENILKGKQLWVDTGTVVFDEDVLFSRILKTKLIYTEIPQKNIVWQQNQIEEIPKTNTILHTLFSHTW